MRKAPPSSLVSATMPAFVEAPGERARMGRISGVLWVLASFITVGSCYLPGARHVAMGWVFALSGAFFVYGLMAVRGLLRWEKASMKVLGSGMILTIPAIGLGIYLTGGADSFVQPMLVTTLLYAAFSFPVRWAWPLSIELILIAGTPLLYDSHAIEAAFLPEDGEDFETLIRAADERMLKRKRPGAAVEQGGERPAVSQPA